MSFNTILHFSYSLQFEWFQRTCWRGGWKSSHINSYHRQETSWNLQQNRIRNRNKNRIKNRNKNRIKNRNKNRRNSSERKTNSPICAITRRIPKYTPQFFFMHRVLKILLIQRFFQSGSQVPNNAHFMQSMFLVD